VKGQLDDVEQRLGALEQREAELDEARENGSISEGRYRAEMSEVAAQTETAKRLANQSGTVSQSLPATVLEERGINATAIQALQDRAGNLSGPEVAEIARTIAGPNVGDTAGDRGPGDLPERPEQDQDRGPNDGQQRDSQTDGQQPDGQDQTPEDGQQPDERDRTPAGQ